MKRLLTLLFVLLTPFPVLAKDAFKTFDLQLLFINGTKSTSDSTLERDLILPWVEEAQRQYSSEPALKIRYTIERKTKAGGRDLSELHFDGRTEYNKFMDEYFDNVARSETEGHLTILVGDRLCWKNVSGKEKCWGGYANFPHDVNPFDRKKGIWLESTADKYTLAHELGHFFSLKHTFEPYVGLNKQCNKDFANKNVFNPDLGHCNSCKGKIVPNGDSYVCQDGVSNLMDYCSSVVAGPDGKYDVTGSETLNVCQQERSANQRSEYLTKEGKVNYIALAGLRGEGACESDADCGDAEF